MTRNHYSKLLGRNLTISEIFESGSKMNFRYSNDRYSDQGIILQENTREEINDFVVERLNSLRQKMMIFLILNIRGNFGKFLITI